jgi:type I restriction enzyme S subunit
MAAWREVSIAELAANGPQGVAGGPFGSSLGRKHYVPSGVPVIRGAQLAGDGRFSLDDLVFVSDEKADRHKGNLAYPGDVIVTQRGTLGQVGVIPSDQPYQRFLLSQSQMKISVDPSLADSEFVHFALSAPEANQRLIDHAMTAGVPHINLATLREFRLRLPDVVTQRRIAAVLSAFDELIEINQRRIGLFEDLAMSLYREWFVRFRFPGHEDVELIDSELGPIPERWAAMPLASLAHSLVDGDWIETKDQGGSAYRLLQVSNIGQGAFRETGKFRYITDETFARLRCTAIAEGDILISRMPEPIGRAWLVDQLPMPAITAVDVAILRPRSSAIGLYLDLLLNSPRFLAEADAAATGTTRKRISRSVLAQLNVTVPPAEHLRAYERLVAPLMKQRTALRTLVPVLAALRDLLLPRLVTGRLDISNVDLGILTPTEVG